MNISASLPLSCLLCRLATVRLSDCSQMNRKKGHYHDPPLPTRKIVWSGIAWSARHPIKKNMQTAHCPLPTAHCPLPTAHCPLPHYSHQSCKLSTVVSLPLGHCTPSATSITTSTTPPHHTAADCHPSALTHHPPIYSC